MRTITKHDATVMIESAGGKIFTAVFEKKDGSIRKMNCRREVSKGITGKGMSYDPKSRGLITVYDMHAKGYRMINTSTLRELSIDGEQYVIDNQADAGVQAKLV